MKADLEDGFLRVSLLLEYAMPFFALTKSETAVMHIVRANTWGHATRSPGYTCELTPVEMVDYLDGVVSESSIYAAINGLRRKTLLTSDPDRICINPYCVKSLHPEVQDRIALMLENHNAHKKYSQPKLRAFRHDSENSEKNSENSESPYKERVRGEKERLLKSSSYLATKDFENAVPIKQTADDDEFKAKAARLRQELLDLTARVSRRPVTELAAELDAVAGRTPREIALGSARLIVALRNRSLDSVVNLRGLLASASGPDAAQTWGSPEIDAVLAGAKPQAPAAPAENSQAEYAAALAAERERMKRRSNSSQITK